MINFNDIKDNYIAIEFDNSEELRKLTNYLKLYNYDYGTVDNSDPNEISEYLGVSYFGGDNKFLSLDRSKEHYPKNYVCCGKGYKDTCYKFNEINWNVAN
ncbi:TPA: hypothetical protein N2D10_003227 [Clostridium botulinum]|nr:hypothetical protein [Clostridium botulinum]